MGDPKPRFDPVRDPHAAVWRLAQAAYPSTPPFHPARPYPEYRGHALGPDNLVYDGVRELWRLLGLDTAHDGSPAWNPLGEIVRPGDHVVVKPNLLLHAHRYRPAEWEQVITHGSIVRAVVDYVLIALDGHGEIAIADGPQLDADWETIVARSGVGAVADYYRDQSLVPVHLLDLRESCTRGRGDVVYERVTLPGDPRGAVEVDLRGASRLAGHAGEGRYYGADYDQAETNRHHSEGRHEYRLSRTVAACDVLINLPKMKTHKKVGVTLCLKNLVGVNAGRNWLPHHTDGTPENGGDQFPASSARSASERRGVRALQRLTLRYPRAFAPLFRAVKRVATPLWGHTEEVIRSGNWYGNDTAWRMVHDINRCVLYTDGASLSRGRLKRYLAVVDGIVAGDGNGPAAPDRREAGLLVAGLSPIAVDCTATCLMGFDPQRLAVLREAFAPSDLPLACFGYDEIRVRCSDRDDEISLPELAEAYGAHFQPHFGWQGRVEWGTSAEH